MDEWYEDIVWRLAELLCQPRVRVWQRSTYGRCDACSADARAAIELVQWRREP